MRRLHVDREGLCLLVRMARVRMVLLKWGLVDLMLAYLHLLPIIIRCRVSQGWGLRLLLLARMHHLKVLLGLFNRRGLVSVVELLFLKVYQEVLLLPEDLSIKEDLLVDLLSRRRRRRVLHRPNIVSVEFEYADDR